MRLRWIFLIACVLPLAAPAHAERKYLFGFSTDILSGITNQAGSSGFSQSSPSNAYKPYYSAYPMFTLKSVGRRSNLEIDYTFTADRYQVTPGLTAFGHVLRTQFDSQLGKKTRLKIDGTYDTTPRLQTLNVLTGITLSPTGGFGFIYEPQLFENVYRRANSTADLEVDLTKSSFLTFSASGSYLHYGESARTAAFLSNQNRYEGGLAYSHRKGPHHTFGVKYSFHQNDFARYGVVRGHSALLTAASDLSPTLRLNLEAGPSYTEKSLSRPEYMGYTASINLTKTIRVNTFTAHYSHRSGDSTGFGGATDSDQVGLTFSRTLGRRTTLRMDANAFDQKQRGTFAYKQRSVGGSMALTRTVGRSWLVGLGAEYRDFPSIEGDYPTGGYPARIYKRLYVSIGYRMPEFWRVSK